MRQLWDRIDAMVAPEVQRDQRAIHFAGLTRGVTAARRRGTGALPRRREMEDDTNTPEEPDGSGGLTEENPIRKPITRERIAERAYLISQSDRAGTDEENWLRAEEELQEEQEG